jgi:hypothetical protein
MCLFWNQRTPVLAIDDTSDALFNQFGKSQSDLQRYKHPNYNTMEGKSFFLLQNLHQYTGVVNGPFI